MIDFQQVSKQFGTQVVLDDVSFRIHPGERVGIAGPNGAGKSTLCALVTGDLGPDRGEVVVPRRARLGHLRQQLRPDRVGESVLEYAENALPQVAALEAELHALEAELPALAGEARAKALARLGRLQTDFEHLGGYSFRHRAQAILGGLGFAVAEFAKPFRHFSGGWQMRAELARVLLTDPDVLILDEPTNFLDVPAIEWLHGWLEGFRGTLLLIAHDRYLLNTLTTVTLEVAASRVTRYPGNYDAYIAARRGRHEQLAALKENQDRKREQLERFVERFRSKASKATQAQSKLKQLERLEEIQLPEEILHPPHIRLPPPPHCGAEVLRAGEVGVTYDGSRWILRHVDLVLNRGDKAALIGLNGMGKTTLLRALAGRLPPSEGTVKPGHQVEIGYFSQDFIETMRPDWSVFQTARQANLDLPEKELRSLLGSFRFSGAAVEKPVEVLSGGEKSRLALLRLLLKPANLLILDEPTSHLDIASREALERALREYGGTMLMVSHDIEFVRRTATTIFYLTPAGLARYYGDYDYFRAKLAAETAAAAATGGPGTPAEAATAAEGRKARKREAAERRNELYKRRKPLEAALAAAEKEADALHAEQAGLLQRMEQPGAEFAPISKRLGEIQQALAAATARWEDVAMQIEELLKGEADPAENG
ncbi:MAG: ABC-F family ATP-binding cassette domain-containing protein [Lentisphaeria bacterium]|jgi:ATP-binding cassette subfamily F protein 3